MDDSTTTAVAAVPDLSSYELDDVATLFIKNARGDDDLKGADGSPVAVTLYGPGSEQGRKADLRFARQNQLRAYRGMRGESSPQDALDQEREHQEKLVAYTVSFSANFPFSPAQVYGNQKLIYIMKQVDAFIVSYGNFSKGSSGS